MFEMWTELGHTIVTIVCSVIASSGFWAFIQKRADKKDARNLMLIGLGHDRIRTLGLEYLDRGWITNDEYENLVDYLYTPYADMGGNGSAKHIIDRVKLLPVHTSSYQPEEDDKK